MFHKVIVVAYQCCCMPEHTLILCILLTVFLIQGNSEVPPRFPTSVVQQPQWLRWRGACQQRERHSKFLFYLAGARYVQPWWHIKHLTNVSRMCSTVSADCPRRPVRSTATLLDFHVPLMNCFVCRWFCMVHGLKPLLHHHNWLSFGKFQDTEFFLIPCPHQVLSRLPPSVQIRVYATAPNAQKKLGRDSLPTDMLLSAVSVLVVAQPSSEVLERPCIARK
jgi:hypothetical protein